MSRHVRTRGLAFPGGPGLGLGLACSALLLLEGTAGAESSTLLRLEATLGAGWRTSIDQNDRNPSFDALMAQAEVAVGPGWGPVALLAGARGRLGSVGNASYFQVSAPAPAFPNLYEATGSLSVQLNIGEHIRARAGGDAGMLWVVDRSAPLAGGFLALSFDAATWKQGRMGAVFTLRVDVDAVLGNDDHLPRVSSSLGLGAGIRY
jgi:hypothetical protein